MKLSELFEFESLAQLKVHTSRACTHCNCQRHAMMLGGETSCIAANLTSLDDVVAQEGSDKLVAAKALNLHGNYITSLARY